LARIPHPLGNRVKPLLPTTTFYTSFSVPFRQPGKLLFGDKPISIGKEATGRTGKMVARHRAPPSLFQYVTPLELLQQPKCSFLTVVLVKQLLLSKQGHNSDLSEPVFY
jgi:hypothetical protein